MTTSSPDDSEAQEPGNSDENQQKFLYEPLPDLPVEKQGFSSLVLISFAWFGRYLLMFVCLGILSLMALLMAPPEYLLDRLCRQIEEIVFAETALPLSIGRIEKVALGVKNQSLQIHNILLFGSAGEKSPLLVIPKIEFKANLLGYFLKQDHLAEIKILSPRLSLIRDLEGLLNLQPEFKPGQQDKSENPTPDLPRIKLLLSDALIHYQDLNKDFPLDESVLVPVLRADLHDQKVRSSGFIRTPFVKLGLNLQAEPFKGQGWGRVHLGAADLSQINRYTEKIENLKIQKGIFEGHINAFWNSWEKIADARFHGDLDVRDLRAQVPFFKPLVELQTHVNLNQDALLIEQFVFKTEGSTLLANGRLNNYRQNPLADLKIQLPHVNLAPLIQGLNLPALKSTQAMHPRGVLMGHVNLKGALEKISAVGHLNLSSLDMEDLHLTEAKTDFTYANNQAQGKIALKAGRWQKIQINDLDSKYHYQPESFTVSGLSASLFSGRVKGQAKIGLDKKQALDAQISGENLKLERALHEAQVKMPDDYRPTGRVDINLKAGGTLTNPIAKGAIRSSQVDFLESDKLTRVKKLNTQFDYSKALTRVDLQADSEDAGHVLGHVTLKNLEHLQADFEVQKLPLVMLNPFTPEAYFNAGTAKVNAQLQGDISQMQRNWMAFRGDLAFEGQDLDLQYAPKGQERIQQALDRASIKIAWQNGNAKIDQFELQENQSIFQIEGLASVPKLMSKGSQENAIQGRAFGHVQLADFPFLKRYQVNEGLLDLDLKANTPSKGGMKLALSSTGSDFNVRGIKIDGLNLETQLNGNKLSIQQAGLTQAGDRFDVFGDIVLGGSSPVLNLQARSEDFNLDTLATLLPPEIREKFTSNPTTLAMPEADNLPNTFRLPQIEKRATFILENLPDAGAIEAGELAMNWRGLMSHWSRWKLDSDRTPKVQVVKRPGLLEDLEGKFSLRAQVTGPLASPSVSVQSVLEEAKISQTGIAESFINADLIDKKISINKFQVLDEFGGSLQAHGSIDLDNDINLEVSGHGVRLKLAEPFLNKNTRMDGNVNFLSSVEGSLKDPQVTTSLELDQLLVNKLFFDKVDTLSGYEGGYLKDARVELRYGDQHVVATGDVPVTDLNNPMDLTLQLEDDSFGLVNLFTSAIDWRKGKGALLVRVVGSPKSPQLEGSIRMSDTEIYLPALKESVSDLYVNGELIRRKDEFGVLQQNVELESVSGHFGGGKITAKGSMDLLNLLPSYFNLQTEVEDVTVRYLKPGLFETVTPIEKANIRIMGLVNQPIISGNIYVGKNGQTVFPFLKGQSDIPVSSDLGDTQAEIEPPRFLFGGLKVFVPESYNLNSPIFDIPVTTGAKGINLRHRGGRVTLIGDVMANEGTLYVLNNALEIESLQVHFDKPKAAADRAIDPAFLLNSKWSLEDVNEPVQVKIDGSLSKLRSNELKIDFDAMQGLTESDLLSRLVGVGVVQQIGEEGGLNKIAAGFTDQVLRGLFDPLTSRFSKLLGLEELSFGLAGQSSVGPVFKFKIRSNPFFIFDQAIEENLPQISFVNKIRLSAEGRLGENMSYDLGTYYRFDEHWALDYKYEQQGSIHNIKVNGNYLLDFVLKWMNHVRTSYFGWQPPELKPNQPEPMPTDSPQAQDETENIEDPSYSSLLNEDPFPGGPTCCKHEGQDFYVGPGLW